ncbi:hypothetical protein LC605_18150 [Nostoc sp. CHAB 5836]|uniref:hypothetical protein n=1 Tax=Nostoc sp. CHAB 5836 TaxID=2780404 RepID=UPI001E497407|nr:hypothetical protein [Nostoc sp. CHAB 5836]MCC5616964.1 hypothetical protein [Nostoc sp. CHAB 5836]
MREVLHRSLNYSDRTVKILPAMPTLRDATRTAGNSWRGYANALFNEPQRRREHRGRRERSLGRIDILLLILQPSH